MSKRKHAHERCHYERVYGVTNVAVMFGKVYITSQANILVLFIGGGAPRSSNMKQAEKKKKGGRGEGKETKNKTKQQQKTNKTTTTTKNKQQQQQQQTNEKRKQERTFVSICLSVYSRFT